MGKMAKTSRKGKKAWRANISTADTEEFIAQQAREERSGGRLDAVPSESLFFVDKSKDTTIEKKTKKYREKILHCDSVLQRNSLVPPLRAPLKSKRKRKVKDIAKPPSKKLASQLIATQVELGDRKDVTPAFWEEGEENGSTDPDIQETKKKRPAIVNPSVDVKAVEIDAPGCSYNPTFEDHQEALGVAVAQEMVKVFQRALEPPTFPRTVLRSSFPIDEEDIFFIDADADDEEEEEDEGTVVNGDVPSTGSRAVKVKRLTRADINRISRRKANLRAERELKEKLKLKKDVMRLPEIIGDISNHEEETEKFRLRRNIARAERRAKEPPRLGKHKFKPAPVQVLLTNEVTGSLRQIKGCYTLAQDRFKSFQRRGIIEPGVKVHRTMRKKRIEYVQGTKGEKEREMHAAREAEREARKTALAVVPL